jgi:zeta toxin
MELPTADSPPRKPDHPAQPAEASQTNRSDHPVPTRTDLPRPPETIAQRDKQRWMERLAEYENPPSDRDELKQRMNQLEPGHPSSPWNDDGTPRDPAPRLRDLEQSETRLSDADYAAHLTEVVKAIDEARATGRTTEKIFTINPDEDIWTENRARVHAQIIEDVYSKATEVPCNREAIMAGGLAGAGKTTLLSGQAGYDLSKYLTINPDTFKEELAKRGLLPELDGLSPMEASGLAHEESSYLAKQLALRAMADGKNLIWDVTMSSSSSTERRIDELRQSDYGHVTGIFVDIPIDTSLARAAERHRRGHDQFLDGTGMGGRYISPEAIRAQSDPEYGSTNRHAFETVKTLFDDWAIYDDSTYDKPASLVECSVNYISAQNKEQIDEK